MYRIYAAFLFVLVLSISSPSGLYAGAFGMGSQLHQRVRQRTTTKATQLYALSMHTFSIPRQSDTAAYITELHKLVTERELIRWCISRFDEEGNAIIEAVVNRDD
jgi:hypothetical protein